MNKTQLINNISKYTKLKKSICNQVLDGLIFVLNECMNSGEVLSISKLGRFYTYYISPTIRVNPHSKLPYLSPSKYTVRFKISPVFLQNMAKTP